MQTLNFREYIPPIEPFVCWGDAFSSEECDKIRELGELQAFENDGFQTARVGGGDGPGDEVPDVRRTDLVWLIPNERTDWIFQRIGQIVGRINFDKFQLDLTDFDGLQFSVYKEENQGHYDWHIDTQNTPPDGKFRKLSIVVSLTDPSEFEGGEFLLRPAGDERNTVSMRLPKGHMLAFYSYTPHKVVTVTKGTRVSLVTWVKGPKWR